MGVVIFLSYKLDNTILSSIVFSWIRDILLPPGIISRPYPALLPSFEEIAGNESYYKSTQMGLPGDPVTWEQSNQKTYQDGQPERHGEKEK